MTANRDSVVLLTANHFCHNPRVRKEAVALAAAGFDVEILGAWTDYALVARDREELCGSRIRFHPVVDLTAGTVSSELSRQFGRCRRKTSLFLRRLFRWETVGLFGAAYSALRQAALQRSAAIYIAHSETGLAVASELCHRGRSVAVDLEDWFSEDLLPEARHDRPLRLLRQFEAELLAKGCYASCPSQAMSRALAREYSTPAPMVLYNAFPWADRARIDWASKDRPNRDIRSIHWYSQTLGMGRGLEDLLAALPHLRHPAQLHLRGQPAPGFEAWLAARLPESWRDRVFVHGLASNRDLLSRIAEHDIGFAGEIRSCRSRDLTVTNKILQYLLAGLAVVASDTEGQKEIAEQASGAVSLYPSGNARALAAHIDAHLGSTEKLAAAKAAALSGAERIFCWERQEPVFLDAVEKALRQGATNTRVTCSRQSPPVSR